MGASLGEIRQLLSHPALPKGRLRVLDIGSQNLYNAPAHEVVAFVRSRNDVYDAADLEAYARLLSLGATVDPAIGGLNGAWLGDLLSRCGIDYTAYDIFEGYGTTIFDLNTMSLPAAARGTFDLVLNCGTTEHVLNQYNSFAVIHDAVRPGGLAYHALPMTGFLDHGYFNYNPRLFFELARANGYELLDLQFNGPGGSETVSERFLGRAEYVVAMQAVDEARARWAGQSLPLGSVVVLLRKVHDAPFRASIETSTTAGALPDTIRSAYGHGESADAGRKRGALRARERQAVASLAGDGVTLRDLEGIYAEHMRVMPDVPYPPRLERFALQAYLRDDPAREDLRQRLAVVESLVIADGPLLAFAPDPAKVDAAAIRMDGREEVLGARAAEAPGWIDTVAEAFYRYHEAGRAEEFPAALECEALRRMPGREAHDQAVKLRLGQLLSRVTVEVKVRRR
jgi:SAM-dependent methyltransferase